MKQHTAPRSFSDPHHNVTLTTSAQDLPLGQFQVNGYFNPHGFAGERVPQYSFRVDSRALYDAACLCVSRMHSNPVRAAEALFEALRPAV